MENCKHFGGDCFLKRFGFPRNSREKDLMELFCVVHMTMIDRDRENEELTENVNILKKWAHLMVDVSEEKRLEVAVLLENDARIVKYLLESNKGDGEDAKRLHDLDLSKIVSVQPMTGPVSPGFPQIQRAAHRDLPDEDKNE